MDESKEDLLPYQETDGSSATRTETDWEQISRRYIHTRQEKIRQWVWYFITALTLLILLGGLLFYAYSSRSDDTILRDVEWKNCGNTTEEARNNGCILDFIPGAWVHPECYDAELEDEFLKQDDWHWYADAEGQYELSKEYIRETGGPNPIYVSMKYHRQHCAYTWKKLHRALIRQAPIDDHIGGYKHTVHCSKALVLPDLDGPSKFFQIFTSCRLPQDCKFHDLPRQIKPNG
jgi:hypothetical protein